MITPPDVIALVTQTHNHTNKSIKAEKWLSVVRSSLVCPSTGEQTRTSECTSVGSAPLHTVLTHYAHMHRKGLVTASFVD